MPKKEMDEKKLLKEDYIANGIDNQSDDDSSLNNLLLLSDSDSDSTFISVESNSNSKNDSLLYNSYSTNSTVISVESNSNNWVDSANRYSGKTQERRNVNNSKLEYQTNICDENGILKAQINEKFEIIDNNILTWKKVTRLNNKIVILELSILNKEQKVEQWYNVYENEESYSNVLSLLNLEYLQKNFKLINETKSLNKILNSKYSFLSTMPLLNLSLGSVSLFETKNALHKENPLIHLLNNKKDILMATITGFTMTNLSYLNYKIIHSKSKWKYLLFPAICIPISIWENYLDLYVSENDFYLNTFIKNVGLNLAKNLFQELIFDKIAEPTFKKLLESIKNKNILKSIIFSATTCSLIFIATSANVIEDLNGEKKAINLENIEKALPLASLVTIIENGLYFSYYSYFNLFLPKIKKSIFMPLTNGTKKCWNKIRSCFVKNEIEDEENLINNPHIIEFNESELLNSHAYIEAQNKKIEDLYKKYNLTEEEFYDASDVQPWLDDTNQINALADSQNPQPSTSTGRHHYV